MSDLIVLELCLVGSFCNSWPEIGIQANGQTLWRDLVEKESTVTVRFVPEQTNHVMISYYNKRNGPDVWDTVVDSAGTILQDQNCVLKSISINRARCDWIIPDLIWRYQDGRTVRNYGFMDQVGHSELTMPDKVYPWIVEQRYLASSKHDTGNKMDSSIDYKNIYIPRNDYELSKNIIAEIAQKIDSLND
jgi:hypothetical protein